MHVRRQATLEKERPAKKRRPGFRLTRIIAALFFLLVLFLSAAVFFHRALLRAYAPTILDTLARELESYYDLEFTWDGYSIAGLNDFTIAGIGVRDIPSDTSLLTSDSVRVRTSLVALAIRGKNPIGAVTSVELNHPVVTLGRKEGRWNTGRLLEPTEGEPFRFPGRLGIVINEGAIEWLGGEIDTGYPFPPSRISGLSGIFRIGANGGMGFRFDGTFSSSETEPASVDVTGTYDPDSYMMHINTTVDSFDLSIAQTILARYDIRKIEGSIDTTVSFLIGPDAGEASYSILGEATLSNGAIEAGMLDLPVRDASGKILFSSQSLFTSGLTANIDGATVTARGKLADFSAGAFSTDLVIEADAVTTSTIQRVVPAAQSIPIDGSVSGRAEVEFSSDGFSAIVSAHSPAFSYLSAQAGIDELLAWYADKKIVVSNAALRVSEGSIDGSGVIDLSTEVPEYEFHVAASEIPSDRLTAFFLESTSGGYMPTGVVSGELDISGQGASVPTVTGMARAERVTIPAYPNIGYASATIPIEISRSGIDVSGATATIPGATILGEGVYRFGEGFTGAMTIAIDDRDFVKRATGLPLQCELAAAGDVSVSLRDGADFTGEVFLTDGLFGTLSVPNMSARIEADRSGIRLHQVSGLMGGGEIEGELTIPIFEGTTARDTGIFELRNLDIAQLLPPGQSSLIATSLDITSGVEFVRETRTLNFNMTVKDQAARFGPNSLSTDEGGISVLIAVPLEQPGSASLEADGRLTATPASAPTYRGRALTPYSARVVREITDLLTGRIVETHGEPSTLVPLLDATFDFHAALTDFAGSLHGSLDVTTGAAQVAGNPLNSSELEFSSSDGTTWNLNLQVDAGEAGAFELAGSIVRGVTIGGSILDLAANVRNSGLHGLARMAGLSDVERTSGMVNASGAIRGTIKEPVIDSFEVTMGESEAFGIPLDHANAEFSYVAPMLQLTGLEIVGRDGFRAMGTGAIDLSAPSLTNASMVLRVDEFELQAISRAFGIEFPIAGTASATVQLAQDALGPKVLYDAGIGGIAWRRGAENLPLGDLALHAESRPGDEQIRITRLEISRDGETLTVSGLVPASLTDAGADLFDLTVVSETGYHPPMPQGIFASGVSWQGGLGPVNLTWTGSVVDPNISGDINLGIQNVKYMDSTVMRSIGGVFHSDHSIVTASPENVRVAGEGWELGVEGRIYLAQMMKRLHAGMDVSLVQVGENPVRISGPGFQFALRPGSGDRAPRFVLWYEGLAPSATFSADLTIVGGQVDIAQLPIAPLSERQNGEVDSGEVPGNPGAESGMLNVDIRLMIGAGIRVRNGDMLNVIFENGEVRFSGPLDRYTIAGSVMAPTGWIDLFGNHFVLIEPLEFDFTSFTPLTDPIVRATAQADLREVQSPGMLGEELTVTAQIDSRLGNMLENLRLTSDPPLSEDQIIAALAYEDVIFRTFGNYVLGDATGGTDFGNVDFTGVALPFATSYLSRYIRREAGFTDFEIRLDQNENVLIYLEKEVFDNLVMFYTQKFGQEVDNEYQWGARYRWRPRSWVGFEVDNDEEITPQVQYIIPID